MVVQHNLPAMNSHRNLGINNSSTSKNLEKLSSGYRINRAGDDAAGLAISEKMRGQIRGLSMAEQNTSNGISLIQTAEGGLNETHAILQRMRELAVQSANGTYDSEVDRANLDLEFQAIKSEIDRIADSTHYNGIKLLNGDLGASYKSGTAETATTVTIQLLKATDAGLVNAELYTSDANARPLDAQSIVITNNGDGTFTVTATALGSQSISFVSAIIEAGDTSVTLLGTEDTRDFLKINLSPDVVQRLNQFDQVTLSVSTTGLITTVAGNGTYKMVSSGHSALNAIGISSSIQFTTAGTGGVTMPAGIYSIDIEKKVDAKTNENYYIVSMGNLVTRVDEADILGEISGEEPTAADPYELKIGDFTLNIFNKDAFTYNDKMRIGGIQTVNTNYTVARTGIGYDITDSDQYVINHQNIEVGGGAGLRFQIGANGGDDQRVKLYVDNMDSKHIGLKRGDVKSDGSIADREVMLADVNIRSEVAADEAIDVITAATNMVSKQRAELGALQNRLEHTLNNLGVTKENLTAAESSIRDVDMAKEMMDFTKNNILVQASQAMLAQANQLPQGVLQLLR